MSETFSRRQPGEHVYDTRTNENAKVVLYRRAGMYLVSYVPSDRLDWVHERDILSGWHD